MKRIINYVIMLFLITLGSILIFNTTITNGVIDFLSNRAYQTKITSSNQDTTTFNYKSVKPVSSYLVATQLRSYSSLILMERLLKLIFQLSI